jgi:hypothetical protein
LLAKGLRSRSQAKALPLQAFALAAEFLASIAARYAWLNRVSEPPAR